MAAIIVVGAARGQLGFTFQLPAAVPPDWCGGAGRLEVASLERCGAVLGEHGRVILLSSGRPLIRPLRQGKGGRMTCSPPQARQK